MTEGLAGEGRATRGARHPDWPDRDRFVLSAGHGLMLPYALTYLTGYSGMTLDEIRRVRRLGSRKPGHPEHDVATGVEATTGPPGQGMANAVGIALAERMMRERFGPEMVDHFTYALAGDGGLMEGIRYEAAAFAGSNVRQRNRSVDVAFKPGMKGLRGRPAASRRR